MPQDPANLLAELLRRTHLSAPDDLARIADEEARRAGALGVDLYLLDYEAATLRPLPRGAEDDGRDVIPVAGTLAGKAYSASTILESAEAGDGRRRLWVPLLDGTERLGVMGVVLPGGEAGVPVDEVAVWERYAHLVATILAAKDAYGDAFERVRRTRRKTIAAELIWELTPPLVFATEDMVVAGMLEPAYDNGGDALDYALNDGVLHLALFDAMGHGLAAAGLATFALSAYRHSRRSDFGLVETYNTLDAAIGQQFLGEGFVTGVIARLDVRTGELTWLSAGHPPPFVVRDDRRTRMLTARPGTPLGVPSGPEPPEVAHEALEPGDLVLIHSDGLTEARAPDGGRLGLDGLRAFVEREAAASQVAPETLRRLRHAILAAGSGELEDDATALLVEWRRGGERQLLPPTV
jgi:hypothetical protein